MNSIQNNIPKMRWLRIIPILVFASFIQNIDKSIISFALPGGMAKELGLNGSISGLLGTAFGIGYLLLQIPFGSLAGKGKCKNLLGVAMLGWSITLFLTATTSNVNFIIFLRVLLGFFEGAMPPAMLTIVANWFPNEERGRATSLYLSATGISQIVMGPLASILLMNYTWRALFYFGAIISFVLIALWMTLLTEKPKEAKWLGEEEKSYILTSIEAERSNKKPLEKAPLAEVLKDINVWKLCGMCFLGAMGPIGLAFWMPTMIANITKTGMTQAGFLSVIPSLAGLIGVIFMGYLSDKTQKRKLLMGICPLIFTGLLVCTMLVQSSIWISFIVLCIAMLFIQGSTTNMWAALPMLLIPEKAGTARGIISMCVGAAGLVSPVLIGYFMDKTGSMFVSWLVIFGFSCVSFLITLTLPSYLNGSKKSADTEKR